MVTCELCGELSESLILTKIAGTNLKVCSKCTTLGKNMEPEKLREHIFRHRIHGDEVKLEVISNYSALINSAMQKRGIDIHTLARATSIRDSTLAKYTTNKIKPDIESAKKIEKFLNIKLIEEFKNSNYSNNLVSLEESSNNKTLGDLFENLQKQKKK